jgi:DNA-binding NarL/FixJ family response regulator
VLAAYDETASAGAFDLTVFAYRANPNLLPILAANDERNAELTDLMSQVGDVRIAKRFGVEAPNSGATLSTPTLTPRERQVYELLAEGKTNREIASTLFITEPTVKVHVRHVFRKLGVRSRTEAAVRAMRMLSDSTPEF